MDRRRFVKLSIMATAGFSIMGCDIFLPPDYIDEESRRRSGDFRPSSEDDTEKSEENDKDSSEQQKNAEDKEDGGDGEGESTDVKEEEGAVSENGSIPRRVLGRTGLAVSIFSMGGSFTISQASRRSEASRIINRALDLGVNYIDTARSYHDSEANIGEALGGRRNEVYLASKSGSRDYDGVMRDIERSLNNLKTDYLDVYQLHGVHSDRDINNIFARNGAIRALEELNSDGTIRFTGITGHKNYSVMLKALDNYDFDVLLMPLNPGEMHDDSFGINVLPVALQKNMGVVAMKLASYGRLFRSDGIRNMNESFTYVLNCPVNTAVIGISSMNELEENVEIAKKCRPLQSREMEKMEARAKPYQRDANFFKYSW